MPRVALRYAEMNRMSGSDAADTAVALMCWDNGGRRLVGLMVVRRVDGHACFVEMPPVLEQRLAVIDVKFVEENAAQLLKGRRGVVPACAGAVPVCGVRGAGGPAGERACAADPGVPQGSAGCSPSARPQALQRRPR
jgi:hypothetical protein